jgi:hypothetical protein
MKMTIGENPEDWESETQLLKISNLLDENALPLHILLTLRENANGKDLNWQVVESSQLLDVELDYSRPVITDPIKILSTMITGMYIVYVTPVIIDGTLKMTLSMFPVKYQIDMMTKLRRRLKTSWNQRFISPVTNPRK